MRVQATRSDSSSSGAGVAVPYQYCAYGVLIVSDTPLALPQYSSGALGQVEFRRAPASAFVTATQDNHPDSRSDSWYRYASLDDGSTYVRWESVGEFLVSADGVRIAYRRDENASVESFQVYMLGQALSFALVKQGFEPLHATAVVVGNEAVAFLGSHAFGKSTLAACFLEAGYRLLTDDLCVLQEARNGLLAHPGPPRIKLFPKMASRFLRETAAHGKMNVETNKLILPIDEHRSCGDPVTLKAIYSLAVPRTVSRISNVTIEKLSPRESFVELLRGTFNRRLVSQQRLGNQFRFMSNLAGSLQIRKLSYPRAVDRLAEVREMVLADVAGDSIPSGGRGWPCPSPTV
jgi:hypothetical protein